MYNPEEKLAIQRAENIIQEKFNERQQNVFTQANTAKQFAVTKLRCKSNEVFAVLFLDGQHRLIAYDELFNGSIRSAVVYPRTVASHCLLHNCSAVILMHNHPSGLPDPSQADIDITKKLKDTLDLIDVRVLDHIVVGANSTASLAERGLL